MRVRCISVRPPSPSNATAELAMLGTRLRCCMAGCLILAGLTLPIHHASGLDSGGGETGAPTRSASESKASSSAHSGSFYSKPGPWGKLKCSNVLIDPTDSSIGLVVMPDKRTAWIFPEREAPLLPDLFERAGLSPGFRASLLDPTNIKKEDGAVHLYPPLLDLIDMTPDMRVVIYRELARHPANAWHSDPMIMDAATVDEWFSGSAVSEKFVSLIRQAAYPIGPSLAFSDLPILMNYVDDDAEIRVIAKSMSRTHTLLVRLELDEETNLESVIKYWSGGNPSKRKDIEPLLRSIAELPRELRNLDVVHLLPPIPRSLLYTYPGIEFVRAGPLPDCHWTSLHFFRFSYEPNLTNERMAGMYFRDRYESVDPPYQYGDVLAFMRADGATAFHSCVYLADDLVYTKNGSHLLRPWVILRLEDVKRAYFLNGPAHIQGLRVKHTP